MKQNKVRRVKAGTLSYADLACEDVTVTVYGLEQFYVLDPEKDYFTNSYGRFEKGQTLRQNQRYNLIAALTDQGISNREFKEFCKTKTPAQLFKFLQNVDSIGFKSAILYTIAILGAMPPLETILARKIFEVLFESSSIEDSGDVLYDIRENVLGDRDTKIDSTKALICAEKMVSALLDQLPLQDKPSKDSVLKLVFDDERVVLLDNNKYVMSKRIYDVENWVLTAIHEEVPPLPVDISPVRACRLGEDQKKAVVGMMTGPRLSVLVGIPGSGKTTTIEAVYAMKGDDTTCITSYTKKACSVLSARLMDYSLGKDKGVRSLMSCYFKMKNNMKFAQSLKNVDMVIMDESSMLSSVLLWYAWRIVQECSPDCRLVLVGDHNQLPPVKSYGRPFQTLIAAQSVLGVKVCMLDTFRRSSSMEIYNAFCKMMEAGTHEIKSGGCVTLYKSKDPESAVDAVAQKLVASEHGPRNTFSIAETNQLCDAVNLATVKALYGDRLHYRKVKEGDKVGIRHVIPDLEGMRVVAVRDVCTRRGERKICNNEMGHITAVADNCIVVYHEIYKREVSFTYNEMYENFQVAYCSTVFKFQGSEDSEVIYLYDSDMNFRTGMNKWALFSQMREQKYVALSRPREKLHIIAISRDHEEACTGVDSLTIKVVDSPKANMYISATV